MKVQSSFVVVYSAVVSTAVLVMVLTGAAPRSQAAFDELTVQRINVVEPDGTLRMVISDHADLPGIIVRGKERAFPRRRAGMLFYNDEGSENGGLIFGGRRNARGRVVDSGGSLSFDKYGANQIVQLAGVDDEKDRFAGLAVNDSPIGKNVRRRVWVGRSADGTASIALMDAAGRKRIVMSVNALGNPNIVFFDAAGNVTRHITP